MNTPGAFASSESGRTLRNAALLRTSAPVEAAGDLSSSLGQILDGEERDSRLTVDDMDAMEDEFFKSNERNP